MANSSLDPMPNTHHDSDPDTNPRTVWLARGRHIGAADGAAEDVLRENLRRLKETGVLDGFAGPDPDEGGPGRVFEARWRVPGDVTVRARLTLSPPDDPLAGRPWVLAAEAERLWRHGWPSPATMFWPDPAVAPGVAWDHHHTLPELRCCAVNPLPADDKEKRRRLRSCARDGWGIHVVVHEAMTPDARGQRPLTEMFPPGLRHRVIEHRAAPQQLRSLNWALKDMDVEVPRGGAVVLPTVPPPAGYDRAAYTVRSVFLDGSEPGELVTAVGEFADLPKSLPEDAMAALDDLRRNWTLLTVEEELARERRLVAMYADALEAMTKSRDLYREAADRANEALAAYREAGVTLPQQQPRQPEEPPASPFRQFTRTLERFRGTAMGFRPAADPETPGKPEASAVPPPPSPEPSGPGPEPGPGPGPEPDDKA
ncbi:hypothetical protein [Streptomyces sp. YIM S03343]